MKVSIAIEKIVTSHHNLVEFLCYFDQAMEHYQNNKYNANFESKYFKKMLKSTLDCIESSVTKIYTLNLTNFTNNLLNLVYVLCPRMCSLIQVPLYLNARVVDLNYATYHVALSFAL